MHTGEGGSSWLQEVAAPDHPWGHPGPAGFLAHSAPSVSRLRAWYLHRAIFPNALQDFLCNQLLLTPTNFSRPYSDITQSKKILEIWALALYLIQGSACSCGPNTSWLIFKLRRTWQCLWIPCMSETRVLHSRADSGHCACTASWTRPRPPYLAAMEGEGVTVRGLPHILPYFLKQFRFQNPPQKKKDLSDTRGPFSISQSTVSQSGRKMIWVVHGLTSVRLIVTILR